MLVAQIKQVARDSAHARCDSFVETHLSAVIHELLVGTMALADKSSDEVSMCLAVHAGLRLIGAAAPAGECSAQAAYGHALLCIAILHCQARTYRIAAFHATSYAYLLPLFELSVSLFAM